ncbi:MAG: glycoside hydrolase family 10 protein [Armatimonadota bacterium]
MRTIACSLLLLIAFSTVAMAAKAPGRIGVYVRFDRNTEMKSPYKLSSALKRIKATGIDFIIPLAKNTSGAVNWDSSIAPEDQIGDAEYLSRIIKYAHAQGLKVYPWLCVCSEGGENRLDSVLNKNTSWAWYYDGAKRGYIDPGNVDARKYLCSLVEELVSKHDLDGLSLDYLRCPNKVGYTESGRAALLKRYNVDLADVVSSTSVKLGTEGGKAGEAAKPNDPRAHEVWPAWKQLRTEQINTLMREIKSTVDKAKPGLPISSYVWGYQTYTGNFEVCQDWKTWIKSGWLDWINISAYRYDDQVFLDAARANRAAVAKGFPFYLTIGVKTSHGELKTAEEVRKQIKMAGDCGAEGLVFFTWEALDKYADDLAPDIRNFGRR